jgi:hypothetical protein
VGIFNVYVNGKGMLRNRRINERGILAFEMDGTFKTKK